MRCIARLGARSAVCDSEVAFVQGQLKQPTRGASQSRFCTDSNGNACEEYAKFERWQDLVKRAYHATEYDEEGEEALANETVRMRFWQVGSRFPAGKGAEC